MQTTRHHQHQSTAVGSKEHAKKRSHMHKNGGQRSKFAHAKPSPIAHPTRRATGFGGIFCQEKIVLRLLLLRPQRLNL